MASDIKPIEITYLALRFTDSVGSRHYYAGRGCKTDDITEATPGRTMSIDQRIAYYLDCVDRFRCGLDGLEWVEVKKTTTFKKRSMNEDKILEIRRQRALAKLTEEDVSALGVEHLAVYDKLKFHNVDDDDSDDELDFEDDLDALF